MYLLEFSILFQVLLILLTIWEPRYTVPNRTTFSRTIIPQLFEKVVAKLKEKRIEGRLDGIEAQLQSGVTVNTKKNNDILSLLPMKTVLDVEDIETKFTTDTNFKSQMWNVIFRIGGTNSKNFIKRTLQRFFTNELSTKYTWTGFRQHNHLRGLQIIKIIKGSYTLKIAVNKYSSTEADFETHVKDWFRHGSQRFGRENK
ncbi:Uncharacterized protein FWK35_00035131 [Aphis craccivora]|uniref:DUF4806 domain-containing protein n=1 Tax=Aphis craccivora TaxID=307492 RepID=A0A6G0VLW5_APHCR|nr:Uncharacterized protein FWK35_00035131 [Aphis craccivora]